MGHGGKDLRLLRVTAQGMAAKATAPGRLSGRAGVIGKGLPHGAGSAR